VRADVRQSRIRGSGPSSAKLTSPRDSFTLADREAPFRLSLRSAGDRRGTSFARRL